MEPSGPHRASYGTALEIPHTRASKYLVLVSAVHNDYMQNSITYRGADKSLARPTSRCILSDGENISFDVNLVIYINSTNIPPIMIINRIYEHQNLLSL